MSLLISLTHYWEGDETLTDVNIYLSKDNHHDTHYFQAAFDAHALKYAHKIAENGMHYINTGIHVDVCALTVLTHYTPHRRSAIALQKQILHCVFVGHFQTTQTRLHVELQCAFPRQRTLVSVYTYIYTYQHTV